MAWYPVLISHDQLEPGWTQVQLWLLFILFISWLNWSCRFKDTWHWALKIHESILGYFLTLKGSALILKSKGMGHWGSTLTLVVLSSNFLSCLAEKRLTDKALSSTNSCIVILACQPAPIRKLGQSPMPSQPKRQLKSLRPATHYA